MVPTTQNVNEMVTTIIISSSSNFISSTEIEQMVKGKKIQKWIWIIDLSYRIKTATKRRNQESTLSFMLRQFHFNKQNRERLFKTIRLYLLSETGAG